jgi:DNA-binding Xre family transcriptional regulator
MDITDNIKQAIKLHGFTSTEVANKLGIVQPQFSRLINNPNIRISDLEKIANAIDCSVVDLIDPSVNSDNLQKYCPFCGKKIR